MDNPSKKSITSDPHLDREFFSPPDPRGDKSFFMAVPTISLALVVATGILVYKVKMWPVMKAKGQNIHIYLWSTRFLVCGTIASGLAFTVVGSHFANDKTEEEKRLAMFGDHKPRKLPKLKIKPYEGNPMALFKTNILEQVLLKKFNAKSQAD